MRLLCQSPSPLAGGGLLICRTDASAHPELDRMLTAGEFRRASQEALEAGITRINEINLSIIEALERRMVGRSSGGKYRV